MGTITVGLGRKVPGEEQFSSNSYHVAVTPDAEITDPQELQGRVEGLFREVEKSLDAEMSRHGSQTGSTGVPVSSGGNGGNGREPASRPTQSGGNGDRVKADPISNKQAKFLFQLARRSGMKTQSEGAGWIHEKLGVDRGVYELTKKEASKAIDLLNNGNGGNGK